MCIGPEVDFFIDRKLLKNVYRFKYLGSFVTSDCSMNVEITTRVQAVSSAYDRLQKRVIDYHDLKTSTKIKVYTHCLMLLLTYGCET